VTQDEHDSLIRLVTGWEKQAGKIEQDIRHQDSLRAGQDARTLRKCATELKVWLAELAGLLP
jgi:hypothetical protein